MEKPRARPRRRWFARPAEPRHFEQEAETRARLYAPPQEEERTVRRVSVEQRIRRAA